MLPFQVCKVLNRSTESDSNSMHAVVPVYVLAIYSAGDITIKFIACLCNYE